MTWWPAEPLGRRAELLLVAIGKPHRCTRFGERLGRGETDPAAGACDEGHLAFENPGHTDPPSHPAWERDVSPAPQRDQRADRGRTAYSCRREPSVHPHSSPPGILTQHGPHGWDGWNIGPVLQSGQRGVIARSRGLTSPGWYQRSESATPVKSP